MKNILLTYFLLGLFFTSYNQQTLVASDIRPDGIKDVNTGVPKTAACGTPYLSSGYPAWTNYWGGYQFNIINLSANDITIHGFEARFQGTSGYRIYTKTGTFIGFETNAGAWTLVGQIAGGLTGLSTTAPTPIPITVDICIPAGATQGFYLTRSDNNAANRHLYVPGTGTPGTTIYASDANLGITEAHYVTPYFAALYAQSRRPSLDVCYSVGCNALPIELVTFNGYNHNRVNKLNWVTATEINNDYFLLQRSSDGFKWFDVTKIDGVGNSLDEVQYSYEDTDYDNVTNYYRLIQFDQDGEYEIFNTITIDNTTTNKTINNITNLMGQSVDDTYKGIVIIYYNDGTTIKTLR
jgi:hypothetical protein